MRDGWDVLSEGIFAIPGGCWLWKKTTDKDGYGTYHAPRSGAPGTPKKAHRLSWELHFGPIPRGLCVCHRCDVPCCVNPGHLFLGTNAENSKDLARKGRAASGSAHRRPRQLQSDQIRDIRRRLRAGERQAAIGRDFGVTGSMVGHIKTGNVYRWVL